MQHWPHSLPLPISAAVRAGDSLYVSGTVAEVDPAGDVEDEISQALRNLDATLHAAGATSRQVVKTVVYLDDLAYADAANRAFRRHFPENPPARTTVSARLVPPYRYEIEAVAYLGPHQEPTA